MKYIKKYESIYDQVKPYLIEKYIIIKHPFKNKYFLLEIIEKKEKMFTSVEKNKAISYIITNKLYTLKENNKIQKNKHQYYNIKTADLDKEVIYKSSNIKDVYGVLASINDAGKYNL